MLLVSKNWGWNKSWMWTNWWICSIYTLPFPQRRKITGQYFSNVCHERKICAVLNFLRFLVNWRSIQKLPFCRAVSCRGATILRFSSKFVNLTLAAIYTKGGSLKRFCLRRHRLEFVLSRRGFPSSPKKERTYSSPIKILHLSRCRACIVGLYIYIIYPRWILYLYDADADI